MTRLAVAVVATALAVVGLAPGAGAQDTQDTRDAAGFTDVAGGVHQPAIDALAGRGLFDGTECAENMFCPGEEMKRWTMAVWLVRVLGEAEPPPATESGFADMDSERWYLPHVELLADLEITRGCLADPLRFCPDQSVSRAQMAAFLVRAFGLEAADPAGFADTDDHFHKADIDALAAARITAGCHADPLRYCPDRPVTRAEMATFLARALGVVDKPDPPAEAPDPSPAPTTATTDAADVADTAATPDAAACRPRGTSDTTAGFPLPSWAAPSIGTVRVAVLFVDFPDVGAAYSTEVEAAHGLPYAEEYLEAASYGRIDVEFVPLHGWLRAERLAHAYLVDTVIGDRRVRLGTEAVRLADPRFDFTGIDVVMTVLPSAHFNAGDHTNATAPTDEGVIGSMAQINTAPHPDRGEPEQWGTTAAHEVAHGLGLTDLYSYGARDDRLPEAPADRRWVRSEFGLMGLRTAFTASPTDSRLSFVVRLPGRTVTVYNYSLNAHEMLAWSRWQLGWMDESQIRCVTAPDVTVVLGPVADPGDAVAMVAVPLSESEVLVMESRRRIGYDTGRAYRDDDGIEGTLPVLAHEGVLVYTVDASRASGELPARLAGDRGDGLFDEYPLLARGQQMTVRGYTIRVVADHGITHAVTITKQVYG